MRILQQILCSFFLLLSAVTHAQKMQQDYESPFRMGLIGGVNINSIDGRSFKGDYKFNYQAGVFFQFNPLTKIGFQPELHFTQSAAQYSNDATEIYDDLFRDGSQPFAKMDIFKLTALVNVDIGPTQRVKWQFGPQWGMVFNQSSGLNQVKSVFKSGDFSVVTGLWLQLPVVFIGGRYEHGFTNLNSIDQKDTWRSRAFQIVAGITF
ncbi:MAG: outer membrane beta-barrel protein [Lacibacter sp.]